MKKSRYEIREMTLKEVNEVAVEWAAKEGWNPGLYDAKCFYKIDPKGFLVGLVDNIPIACISAVTYGNDFGFLGFYIVKPEFRGKGYGIKIWKKAMRHLGNRNIGLDGVIAQQENYKKSGFKLAYNNARYEYESGGGQKLNPPGVRDLAETGIKKLADYDQRFFPTKRKNFLKAWVSQPESTTKIVMPDREIAGYGMIRKCRQGYKIGPLFADNYQAAENIFGSLVGGVPAEKSVFMDIPEINSEAGKLVTVFKMKKVFSTARMYTKTEPKLPVMNIYGVTTLEVG